MRERVITASSCAERQKGLLSTNDGMHELVVVLHLWVS